MPKMFSRTTRPASAVPRRAQRGFALVELIVAVSIAALLGVYASAEIAKRSEEAIAEGAGVYIAAVSNAAQLHALTNFDDYANGLLITGVAIPLQPTIAELVALGRLNPGFPSGAGSVPTRQSLRIDITLVGCPGPGCTQVVTACTTSPVTLGGTITRFDLASTMVQVQGGRGGQSLPGQGTVIRGPAVNVPNPLGNVEGIVCGSSSVDTAFYQQFVKIADTRDPNLQGPLTVAGAVNFANTATIAGATTINSTLTVNGPLNATGDTTLGPAGCARILAVTGRAGFGCTNPDDIPVGYTGGVRTPDVVATGRVVASDNPAAFTGSNGNFAFMGVEGGIGEMRTSGRAVADRLTPQGTYVPGSACVAADDGSIARNAAAPGLVYCQSGQWSELATLAVAGAVCAPEGAMATAANNESLLCVGGVWRGMGILIPSGVAGAVCSAAGNSTTALSATGESLLCKINPSDTTATPVYYRLADVTTNLTFVRSVELGHDDRVTRPTCTSPPPFDRGLIQLISKSFSSIDGGFDVRVVETPLEWRAQLTQGSGAAQAGVPIAVAQIFCYFP